MMTMQTQRNSIGGIVVGLVFVFGMLVAIAISAENRLDKVRAELKHLERIHTATVNACGEAWLKLPLAEGELKTLEAPRDNLTSN